MSSKLTQEAEILQTELRSVNVDRIRLREANRWLAETLEETRAANAAHIGRLAVEREVAQRRVAVLEAALRGIDTYQKRQRIDQGQGLQAYIAAVLAGGDAAPDEDEYCDCPLKDERDDGLCGYCLREVGDAAAEEKPQRKDTA